MASKDIVPAQASQYYQLGVDALYKTHRYEDAVFYLTEYLRYHRTDENAYEHKITALMQLDRFKEAIRAADFLIELNLCNHAAYINKALAWGFLEKKFESLQTIDQGIARLEKRIHNLSSSDNAKDLQKGIEELRKLKQQLEKGEQGLRLVRNRQTGSAVTLTQENLQAGSFLCGVQGSGKSSVLVQAALEQIAKRDECVIVLDPTGDMCRDIILRMPQARIKDTSYLSLKQYQFPFLLNLFSYPDPGSVGFEARNAGRNQIYQAFYKIFPETSTSVYFKGILRNLIPILLDHPAFTIFHVEDFILDSTFRSTVLKQVDDARVKRFWEKFHKLPDRQKQEESAPFLRRLEELLDDPAVANHIGQKKGLLDIRKAIQNKEILLIHLPIDEMAYKNAAPVIGTFLMMQIYAATFSFSVGRRPGFTLLVDEFSKFAYGSGDEFADLFSFGRKYAIKQMLCTQYMGQFDEEELQSLKEGLTSAYTIISLRTNHRDSRDLASLFSGLTRKPTDIETDVFSGMAKHKTQSVREFWWHVIKPLQEKAKEHLTGYYGKTTFSYDFGFGVVEGVDPEIVEEMFRSLNNLLYYSQKKGQVDEVKRTMFIHAYAELAQARTTRRMLIDLREEKNRKIQKLTREVQSSKKMIDSWEQDLAMIDHKPSEDMQSYHRDRLGIIMGLNATQADLPKIENALSRIKSSPDSEWREVQVPDESIIERMIDAVLTALIADPIATTNAELELEDISEILKGLPNRQGLAKIEGKVYEIQTIDLPDIVSKEIAASRWNTIEAQTKKKYCRGRREIERAIEKIYTTPLTNNIDHSLQQSDGLDKYEDLDNF